MDQAAPKRVFIKSYGCQMNVYDSERMQDVLTPLGYEPAGAAEDADLIILNTCHIREKAAEKVYSELGRLKPLKAGRDVVIGVAGCVAQAEGEEIIARAPTVDLVFGPQTYQRLPDMLDQFARTGDAVIETDFSVDDKFEQLKLAQARKTKAGLTKRVSAFVTVQEGCDKFCTFCVVPYTRGSEFSRNVRQIETEVMALVEQGVREITLLGQNVNAYHGEGPDGSAWSLGRLLNHLAEIDGLDRLRYTTSHPRDMDDELIEAHGHNPKLMPYLHLPVQAGSDRILKAMNRRHTVDSYLRIIERIRKYRPDIALSGDFIVGFPGETDRDFDETLKLVREVGYAQAYSFKYSARPGTPAADRAGQVPEEEKASRLNRLQELLLRDQVAFNRGCIGRILPVLLEKPGRHPSQLVGRSPYLQAVHLKAKNDMVGEIVEAEIVDASANSLSAVTIAV